MKLFILFALTFIFIILLDYIWLGLLFKSTYLTELGNLARTENGQFKPYIPAAIIVYLLLVSGIIFFVLPVSYGMLSKALFYGVLFGLITYGIYDFTNYAILDNWSLRLTMIDICWGMILCGCTSFFAMTMREYLAKL